MTFPEEIKEEIFERSSVVLIAPCSSDLPMLLLSKGLSDADCSLYSFFITLMISFLLFSGSNANIRSTK